MRTVKRVAHKWGVIAIVAIMTMCITGTANAQMKVAVMDFKAGVGVEQGDVDGISAIFGTYFIAPQEFTLVERTQIDRVIAEQGFQQSSLTNQQMVAIGQILNIQRIIVGDVNIVSGQYNVDVRVVDVRTGAVQATEGATWTKGTSYRELMKNLATRLMTKLKTPTASSSQGTESNVAANTVVTLYGYLKIFPEDLGDFPSAPVNVITALNSDVPYGYNDWRIPTVEEMALIKANRSKIFGIGNAEYITSDGQNSGVLRLVTTGKTFAEKEEVKRKQEEEQKRLAEEQKIKEEEQRKVDEQRRNEEAQIMASLSPFEAARLDMLQTYGQDIGYTVRSSSESSGFSSAWEWVDYTRLYRIATVQTFLKTYDFWWGGREVNNYSNQPLPCIGHRKGHSLPGWQNISVYNSQSNSYQTQRMAFYSRSEITDCQLPSDVVFMKDIRYADMRYRRVSQAEAMSLVMQIKQKAREKLRQER